MKILLEVKTSYAKIGGKYEVTNVVETELPFGEDDDFPQDVWINEYLEVEYFIKEE